MAGMDKQAARIFKLDHHSKKERGQSIIIIAAAFIGLLAFIGLAVDFGIPCPSMSSALNYYDSYRSARLPANLLQAQRDYFGAHTYERLDKPRGEFFHTDWTGQGGTTASSTYVV